MFPVLFESSGFPLPTWHVFFVFGVILGFLLFTKLSSGSIGLVDTKLICATSYITGILGARWFSVLVEENHETWLDYLIAMTSLGSVTFYGGAVSGALSLYFFCRIRGISPALLVDLAIPALMLGLSFGRIGCLFNGCDYGIPYPDQNQAPWWAFPIPVLNDGVYRYPVQLYEALIALNLAFITYFMTSSGNFKRGLAGSVGICGYAVARFFLEFIRGDYRGFSHLFFSPSQIISVSIVLFLFFITVFHEKTVSSSS